LGHNLTSIDEIHGQSEDISQVSVEEVKKFVSYRYSIAMRVYGTKAHGSVPRYSISGEAM